MFFFFNDTATTEIYTLSLHDALPILGSWAIPSSKDCLHSVKLINRDHGLLFTRIDFTLRSEEHTSELQSRPHLVCRLLLEKKNAGSSAAFAADSSASNIESRTPNTFS